MMVLSKTVGQAIINCNLMDDLVWLSKKGLEYNKIVINGLIFKFFQTVPCMPLALLLF